VETTTAAAAELPAAVRAQRLGQFTFFLSGVAALLYQVLWQRLLVVFSGTDVYSVTIIVAAFMGGLGIGSLVGGRLADRVGARSSLWWFAGAELAIGLFGLASKALYYDLLYGHFPQLVARPGVAAAALFASLLGPTFLMGVSLPLLARGLVDRIGTTGRVVGSLYGWNTLGAAMGALLGTWLLLPRVSIERALLIAAGLNFSCVVLAAVLARHQRHRERATPLTPADVEAEQQRAPAVDSALRFRFWVAIYGLTGFVALGLEIVWFRLLGVMLKSGAFTFGTLLMVYLAGLGLGAATAARRVGRSQHPGLTFLLLQYGAILYAALSIVALMAFLDAGHPIKLIRYFGEYEPVNVFGTVAAITRITWEDPSGLNTLFEFTVLYVLVPAAIIGPPTFLMGMSFPYLQKGSQSDLTRLGQRLGTLLASNIAGAVFGTMIAGLLLIPAVGAAGTLKVLVGIGVLLAWPYGCLKWPGKPLAATATTALALLVASVGILLLPESDDLWARLHAVPSAQVLVAEDASGLSLLKAERSDFRGQIGVYVNGLGQSWIPYGGGHTVLGALPSLIHPAPREILVIGLGSGDTAFAAAGRPELRRLVCVEIIGAQLSTLRQLARVQSDPGLTALLSNPRVQHEVGDGRAYIRQAGRRFDIIEADALRPTSAHAGNLYSREYFDLLRRHLAPGGFAVTWAPTERTRHTFMAVFPHVLGFGEIYIGSDAPITFDRNEVAARARAVRSYYDAAGVDIVQMLEPYLNQPPLSIGPQDPRVLDELNTDTFARDEFALPF
jgi:spermidine synthase/MFS family permease